MIVVCKSEYLNAQQPYILHQCVDVFLLGHCHDRTAIGGSDSAVGFT